MITKHFEVDEMTHINDINLNGKKLRTRKFILTRRYTCDEEFLYTFFR